MIGDIDIPAARHPREGTVDRERQPDRRAADQGAGSAQGHGRHDRRRRTGHPRLLDRLGLPVKGSIVTDGSGLDDGNRATCPFLVVAARSCGPSFADRRRPPDRRPDGHPGQAVLRQPGQKSSPGQDRHADERVGTGRLRGHRARCDALLQLHRHRAGGVRPAARDPGGSGSRARALPRGTAALRPLGPETR